MSQSKKSNFSLAEVEVLVDEIDMHKHIIFAKQNNIITNSKKKIVWESIKENVNSVDNNTRTAEDVKKKWQMLASSVKAKWNLIRLESNKTGAYNILFIYFFLFTQIVQTQGLEAWQPLFQPNFKKCILEMNRISIENCKVVAVKIDFIDKTHSSTFTSF